MSKKEDFTRSFVFETAWGWCGARVSPRGLDRVIIPEGYGRREIERMLDGTCGGAEPAAVKFLRDYFAGGKASFEGPLDLAGRSKFERAVYRETARIPYGRTASYGDIARRVGRPGAARAVGTALAKNPVPIIIPCHRVVRADGSPGGFSSRGPCGPPVRGDGSATKTKLLAFEKQRLTS